MDLVTESDTYSPTFKDNIYQDFVPFCFTNGIRCPCSTRKDKSYKNRVQFKSHINTKKHKEWLSHLNENRINFYKQSIEQTDTIKNQRLYIAHLEKKLTAYELQEKYRYTNVPVTNLLDIDL
tara:strand:- start:649 stop:1014 length:366 start_codon:yes stop_codon:yes gene_type:complete